ncbi:MAG: hypothetical protein WEE89_20605 [Gemmatimonadota bacterium]
MLKVAFTVALFAASSASAQLISIRTVPVSQAHQFEIFPSRTMSMGGVSIAVADELLDPFSNPASGARITTTRFFGSPSAYNVTSGAGGGRTLPVGALSKRESWYGGVWLALQEVDLNAQTDLSGIGPFCPACSTLPDLDLGPVERTKGNTFAFAMAGKELAPGLSLGSSVLWSGLNAVDGVDLLYAGSARINQSGNALDVRLGLMKEWAGERTLEVIGLHNRFATSHDVYYLDSFWDPGTQQFSQRPRLEENLDHTRTWGLHLAYDQPLSQPGWRAGSIFTFNRMDHPKLPNYQLASIQSIPRDPGNSSAFNIGFGLSRVLTKSTFGIDLVYEPIWSHTWDDAATPVQTVQGRTIPAGGRTIENRFRFSNAQARIGLDQEFYSVGPVMALQLGLAVNNIHYWLEQHNHIQNSDRSHEESWVEKTPTWGVSVRFPELEIRYHGSVTHGTGRPGVQPRGGWFVAEDRALTASAGSNILAPPSGALSLTEVKVTTHRISISLPIH